MSQPPTVVYDPAEYTRFGRLRRGYIFSRPIGRRWFIHRTPDGHLAWMNPRTGTLATVIRLLCEGKTTGDIERSLRVSKDTARRARRFLQPYLVRGRRLPNCPCGRPTSHTGMCHWRHLQRPLPPARLAERFWGKVEKAASCWHWRGAFTRQYAHGREVWRTPIVRWHGRLRSAHLIAYELATGRGISRAHRRCGHLDCVNPSHLMTR